MKSILKCSCVAISVLFTGLVKAEDWEACVVYPVYAKEIKANTLAVYQDRNGDFYPPKSLQVFDKNENFASIKSHYNSNKNLWAENLIYLKVDDKCSFENLQTRIIEEKANEINEKVQANALTSVTFILVGFNNPYDSNATNVGSRVKLDLLIDRVNEIHRQTLFVKIYWDGRFKEGIPGAIQTFSPATTNSYYVGWNLRKLIQKISCPNINFISHSLGANVVCEAIFNEECKMTDEDDVANHFKSLHKIDSIFITGKNIKAAIIAPAMPGTSTFIDYFDESLNPKLERGKIKWLVGFSRKDKVLRKFIGLTAIWGSNTLGTRLREVGAVNEYFRNSVYKGSFKYLDFSGNPDRSLIHSHDLENYLNNDLYTDVIDFLFD